MLKKFYEKNETLCIILLIASYVILGSLSMQKFGYTSVQGVIGGTIYSLILLTIILATKSTKYFGFTKPKHCKEFLYFIPLFIISTVNIWNGFDFSRGTKTIIIYILQMINVGFIEEVIFRGFLFKSMQKDNEKLAIIVSSLTFGIGHIANLLNGAELIPTIVQICYAIALGFLFVTIFLKSGSLIPCIISHIVINSLSSIGKDINNTTLIILNAILILICLLYIAWVNKKIKKANA